MAGALALRIPAMAQAHLLVLPSPPYHSGRKDFLPPPANLSAPGLAPQSPIGLPCEEWASHTALGWSLHSEIRPGSRAPCQEGARPSSENQTKGVVIGVRKSHLPCLDSGLCKGLWCASPPTRLCGEEKGSRVRAERGLGVEPPPREKLLL